MCNCASAPSRFNFSKNITMLKVALARFVSALTLVIWRKIKYRNWPKEFFTSVADKRGEIPSFVIAEILLQHTVFSVNLLASKLVVSFKVKALWQQRALCESQIPIFFSLRYRKGNDRAKQHDSSASLCIPSYINNTYLSFSQCSLSFKWASLKYKAKKKQIAFDSLCLLTNVVKMNQCFFLLNS